MDNTEGRSVQWSPEDVRVLKGLYPSASWKQLYEAFPRSSYDRIVSKAHSLKIKRSFSVRCQEISDTRLKNGNTRGPKNGRWANGHNHYRRLALERAEFRCEYCGFDKVLDVHHIDFGESNYDLGNLIVLCPNHHLMIHRKLAFVRDRKFVEQKPVETNTLCPSDNVFSVSAMKRRWIKKVKIESDLHGNMQSHSEMNDRRLLLVNK